MSLSMPFASPFLRLLRRHPLISFIAILLFSPSLLRALRSLLPLIFSISIFLSFSLLVLRRYLLSSSTAASPHRSSPSVTQLSPAAKKTWMCWMKGLDDAARSWMEEKLLAEGIPLSAVANKETAMALLQASFGEQHRLLQKNPPSTPPSLSATRPSSPPQSRRASASPADKKKKFSPSSAVSCRTRASASSSLECYSAAQQKAADEEARGSAAIAGSVKKVTFAPEASSVKEEDKQRRRRSLTGNTNAENESAKQATESDGDGAPLPVSSIAPDVSVPAEDVDGKEWRNPFDDEDSDHHVSSSPSSSSSESSAAAAIAIAAAEKSSLPASSSSSSTTTTTTTVPSTSLRFSSFLPKPSSSPANKLLEASRRIFHKDAVEIHSKSTPSDAGAASSTSPPPARSFSGVRAPSSKKILEACRRFSSSSAMAEGAASKEVGSGNAKARKQPTDAPVSGAEAKKEQQQQAMNRRDKSSGDAKKKEGSATEMDEEAAAASSSSSLKPGRDPTDHGILSFKKNKAASSSSSTIAARTGKRESSSTATSSSLRPPFLAAFK